ncbi:MAG TPA: phosphoribosylanthranilate isomerase [Candidatus Paenalcaligenes intestinipullorum]|uniref:N-(5'-phosphoribosyl)anthranilate isomerase n=1 Tax=Candidatus Paenalcaligenes intestinipullorum TaxID=2838718 RepID=A0A9D2U8K6_9BURK|nr:phosphoribosylanthranilate isomerase [Candidatus Paenalcaligenes intestinipullorum]
MSPRRVRVKFCGFTHENEVQQAVQLGADAIGLVFYPPSKRALSVEQGLRLRKHIPAFVSTVALVVNPDVDEVHQLLTQLQPELLQFHGDESPEFCEQFAHPYMKAFRVGGPDTDTPAKLLQHCQAYQHAKAWLFDSYSQHYGGTGVRFDTRLLEAVQRYAAEHAIPIVLAGGLTANNVAAVLAELPVFAVDVSSGIENQPGQKSFERMAAFMDAVQPLGTQRV